MARKKPWIDRRCCDWDTFLCGLVGASERLKFPLILVDWCDARRYWRRHGCTGFEVIKMQRAREMNAGLYLWFGSSRPGRHE